MKKAFTSASKKKKKKKKKKEAAAFFVSSRGCFGSSSSFTSSSSFGGTLVIMRYSFIQVCSLNNTFFPHQRREKSTVKFGKEERVCLEFTLPFQTLNKKP